MGLDVTGSLTLAAMLLAWWYVILMALLVGGWAWVVSTVFDKDAAKHYLPRQGWNAVHILFAAVAIAAGLLVPLPIFATLPIMALILGVDLLAYFIYHNKDERVPDAFKWSLNPATWKPAAAASGKKGSKKDKQRSVKGITMTLVGPKGRVAPPSQEQPEYPVRIAVEDFLSEVLMQRASKATIRPIKEGVYGAIAIIDGMPKPLKQMSANDAMAMLDYMKRAAGMNVDERRKRQRGTLEFGFGETAKNEAWLTTMGSSQGVKATLLLDPAGQVDYKAKDLGFLSIQEEPLAELASSNSGVVLLAAPDGHGRTSLLYAMVRQHDAYTSNIQILEYETQRTIEGVRHTVFDPQEGGEFATTARSLLRRDPDVVGMADVPDEATAQVVARADHSHTRTYASLVASDPLTAIQAFVKAVGDPQLAADSLAGVVSGRLLRKLCDNCRIAYKPTPEMLKKLGLSSDVHALYRTEGKVMVKDRPEPCPVCGGVGYMGLVGAYAVHPIRDEDRPFIASGDYNSLRGAWRQRKQPSIQTAALQLLIDGKTSVDELVRVLQGAKKKTSSSSAGPGDQAAKQPAEAKG